MTNKANQPMTAPMPENPLAYATLKARHRLARDGHPAALALRIHRALSWLYRAEQAEDVDGKFIFLWIAFNAAYAQEFEEGERVSDKATFTAFLEKLCALDTGKWINNLIWKEFSGSIRALLDNPYVFRPFWDFQRGQINEPQWKSRFAKAKKVAQAALASGNTPLLLSIVFDRLYTLRNQLMHGGATWNSKINRDQLRDCTCLFGNLVPMIIALMMDNPDTPWGDAVFPVVNTTDNA